MGRVKTALARGAMNGGMYVATLTLLLVSCPADASTCTVADITKAMGIEFPEKIDVTTDLYVNKEREEAVQSNDLKKFNKYAEYYDGIADDYVWGKTELEDGGTSDSKSLAKICKHALAVIYFAKLDKVVSTYDILVSDLNNVDPYKDPLPDIGDIVTDIMKLSFKAIWRWMLILFAEDAGGGPSPAATEWLNDY